MGRRAVYLVSHPEQIKYILTRDDSFGKGMNLRALDLLGSDSVTLLDGEHWRPRRRSLRPLFRPGQILAFAPLMLARTEAMLDRWRHRPDQAAPLDIADEMMQLTLDIITRAMFSASLSALHGPLGGAVRNAMGYVGKRLWSPFNLPTFLPTPANVRFRQARATIDATVDQIISNRRAANAAGERVGAAPDMLTLLLGQAAGESDEDSGLNLSEKQLHDEVLAFFVAGHESIAVTLTWTWYLLSMHPAVERRMGDELFSVLGDRAVTVEDLPRLTYTRQVIEESLRLYPPGWALSRTARVDTQLGDFAIPAESLIMLSPYVTHRHTVFWDNPEGFDPDRFAPEHFAGRSRYAFFPFGGGPYTCIAARFALMEAQIVLATVAQHARLHLVPGRPVIPQAEFTLRPANGLPMILQRR